MSDAIDTSDDAVHHGIRCKLCNTDLYSNYTHDFKYCQCGECFIDGGFSYMRAGFHSRDNIEFISKPREAVNNKEGK